MRACLEELRTSPDRARAIVVSGRYELAQAYTAAKRMRIKIASRTLPDGSVEVRIV